MDLLLKMLLFNPLSRITAADALSHPYLSNLGPQQPLLITGEQGLSVLARAVVSCVCVCACVRVRNCVLCEVCVFFLFFSFFMSGDCWLVCHNLFSNSCSVHTNTNHANKPLTHICCACMLPS